MPSDCALLATEPSEEDAEVEEDEAEEEGVRVREVDLPVESSNTEKILEKKRSEMLCKE
jgi:hypothetical protein